MPELPEVETIRRDLSEKILDKKITAIKINLPKIVQSDHNNFQKVLIGNSITQINRRGKLMILELKKGSARLLIHLRMTGQLVYQDCNQEKCQTIAGGHGWPTVKELPHKHTHLILEFQDGSRLYYNDQRQFGYFRLVTPLELEVILSNYGIEPLASNFTLDNFQEVLLKRKKSIKATLLDQSIIAGLGNIYVDEACFAAGVHPNRPSSSLKKNEIKRLHDAIQEIITLAIQERGTTFSDFVDAEGRHGNFINLVQVYGREGEKCSSCLGSIEKIRVAGRGTHLCPHCQK